MIRGAPGGCRWLLPLLLSVAFLPLPGMAQESGSTFGTGTHFHGYSFGEGVGITAAELLMAPVAFRQPLGDALSVDLYTAWARGRVERAGRVHSLSGATDTQLRGAYQAAPWALVTLSTNLPTGHATHGPGEAVVASVLATDLLGFREGNWGVGWALTPGLALAGTWGDWSLGTGAGYRVSGEFEPEEVRPVAYEPGDELRARLGADRNIGDSGKLTVGFTFRNYDTDRLDGRNLFVSGRRYRLDGSYAFRAEASTWTVFGSTSWREKGELSLTILDPEGTQVGDSLVHTSPQHLSRLGVSGSVAVGDAHRLRPVLDLTIQARQEDGSGWLLGVGGDLPIGVIGGFDLSPRAKILYGRIDGVREAVEVWGGELGATLRWDS